MKRTAEKYHRHDWRPGIEQHCGNVGCAWRRKAQANRDFSASCKFVYRYGALDFWAPRRRVPKCGGKP